MSFAYLPLFTGDYQRDTLHLSMLEHGAYLKLLMYCWDQQGPAPDDDRKLAGICNARSKEEVTAVRAILEEFFVLMDDGWYNKRLVQELDKARATSEMAHARGRMSAEARRQKYGTAQPGKPFESLSKASQKASESLPNPPSPSPSLKEKTTPSVSREKIAFDGSRFEHVSAYLPAWREAYPAVDVEIEINKAAAWLITNPRNKKSNYERFLNGWLSRAQDRAPRASTEPDYSLVRD